jgi:hypothetical protein
MLMTFILDGGCVTLVFLCGQDSLLCCFLPSDGIEAPYRVLPGEIVHGVVVSLSFKVYT